MLGGVPVAAAIARRLWSSACSSGLVNGALVAYLNLSAFVATLATLTSVTGLAFLVTEGTTLFNLPPEFNFLGQGRLLEIPLPVFIAIAISVILWFVLRFTTLGRRWYAIGGNVEVSRLSGVNVRRARLLAFTVAGLVSAIGGILLAARLGSASAVQGEDNLLFSVAAVFLGMTIVRSGAANIVGTMVGVAIIGVMSNGLNILGVNAYVQQVVTGLIIIAAVTLSSFKTRVSDSDSLTPTPGWRRTHPAPPESAITTKELTHANQIQGSLRRSPRLPLSH